MYKLLWITCALPDKNGKTSGRPKLKGKHYYNSFCHPQLSNTIPVKNANSRFCINLPKIGLVPFVDNRPIPVGFKVKTGTVIYEIVLDYQKN
ncbi:hypothetical protein CYANOKiyG1_30990 [Okeania sp. KiyG1]|nr:hypothetical protein CYANOKiyG1_30990 [Okeania sp. KiyG1]